MNRKLIIASVMICSISLAFVTDKALRGVDVGSMDKSANPREDFYQYANGSWCLNNPVPSSEARWTSFNVLSELNNIRLKEILENAAADKAASPESIKGKIGLFYRIAMDTVKLENEGTRPVSIDLDMIRSINTTNELMLEIGRLHKKGINALFSFDVSQDIKNSDQYISYLGQGGLGLPDRDYYFKEDEKSQNIRTQYKEYIASMLSIHRLSPVNADGSQNQTKYPEIIFNIESNLARVCMTRVERRDMEKQYNKKSISELKSLTPSIDWDVYFNEIGITQKNITNIVVQQPDFFLHINQAFKDVSIDDWKVYLEWKVVNATSGYLNSKLSSRSFDFYGKLLTGTKEQKPRWKRVVSTANSMIGELVAQEYVKVAFSEDSKRRINEMVDNLRDAFRGRIEKLEWMSPETKTKAIEKLQSFNRKLGYPDKWKDYTELRLTPESYLQLYYTSSEFEHIKMIDKLGKPIDKSEWEMLPQTVNAYYNPVNNEIVFPAAIMQPPFFNPLADDAVNYGAIGAVIGHEFSHGFDDQGSKFDSHGNMNNWWSDNDKQKFEAKTKILADQYNKYSVEDKVFVNGQLTLGENIADFAGLTVSYDAYQRSLKGKSKVNIDGFTPEQRFFIGFAQVWKNNSRPEYLRQQVMTDPHSPGRFRVLGPLSNMPEFYSAFGVKSGDKMYIDEKSRAKIW